MDPDETDEDVETLSVPIELDDDGFLRRECPACEREFKWLDSSDDEGAESMPKGGYYCPYCRAQSEEDWFTKAQAEYLTAYALEHSRNKIESSLGRTVDRINRADGLITASFKLESSKPVKPVELNDMRRVEFGCHPGEPVKVADDWAEPVHCLLCGTAASST